MQELDNKYVIIPSLNPDEKLVKLVNELKVVGFNNILLVDDGSDKEHKKFFKEVKGLEGVIVLKHKENMGKGAALKTAFKYLLGIKNINAAITVDGDGQHLPEDIVKCCRLYDKYENQFIFGCRNFDKDNVPLRSKLGNKITRSVMKALCGLKLSDTQTGLRVIPYNAFNDMLLVEGDRFEYETNMLLYIKKNKVRYKEQKIKTVYIEENKSSHFNPIVDSFKIYKSLIKFSLSGSISCLVDIGLFTLFNIVFKDSFDVKERVLYATIFARVISAMINYYINYAKVFKSKKSKRCTFVRYASLAIVQVLISYILVYKVVDLFSFNVLFDTLVKIVVDVLLFFVSYKVQKKYVF